MIATLSKGDGNFYLVFSSDGKRLLPLTFTDWLSARVTLDIFSDEECTTIEKCIDTTREYINQGYAKSSIDV